MSLPESGKLLDGVEVQDQEKDRIAGAEDGGKPNCIQRVTWVDLTSIVVVLIATLAAAIVIFVAPAAMALGQKNQLIVLGFLLSIMSSCSARQIQKLSLIYEARSGRSTLQNFDALLRSDYFSTAASLGPRSILLFLFSLPLGLSVAYKQFLYGSTICTIPSSDAMFGFTAAPGYQLIGNGLSLFAMTYLPFWRLEAVDPGPNQTYGFNLFIVDNQTAAVLDAPLPAVLTNLQQTLDDNEYIYLTAQVDATVTQSIPPSASERDSAEYWEAKKNSFPSSSQRENDFHYVGYSMWIGSGFSPSANGTNYTETFLSIFNTTLNQTFESQADRLISTRRTCVGTWNITNANVTLNRVENLKPIDELQDTDQSIIESSSLNINDMFMSFLGEYDWVTRGNWYQPLPGSNLSIPPTNTRPSFVASMLWARITSAHGPERGQNGAYPSASYNIDGDKIITERVVQTVHRSPWLMFIMVIQPVLTILAVLGKAVLHTSPISENFGIISLLAGATGGSNSQSLQGAAFSGTLKRDVKIAFKVRNKISESAYDRLEVDVDVGSQERSAKLHPRTLYG